ncbi:DUF6415 family natural product biosynthesis protein [Streptomyces sp. NPDC127159]|uniref:DUF6415 family natural product biosynthesis protein n=1 Tax=unclassified Streptomyces TaxID=2593676 RepID=UPI003637ABCC
MNGTARTPAAVDLEQAPPDIDLMRTAIYRLLDPDATPDALPPAPDEVDTLTLQIRGHLAVLMPEVELLAARLRKDSIPRYCALACLGEARGKLRTQPSPALGGDVAYARRLARALNALCDHYEALQPPA